MSTAPKIDFDNTEIAFEGKSNAQLRKMDWLFSLMNKSWLVQLGSNFGIKAIQWRLPFAETLVKNTIFDHFCVGVSLEDSIDNIEHLYKYKTFSILDYGAEAAKDEAAFDRTMQENIKAIHFAAKNPSVPVISTKISGLAQFELLEKKQRKETFSPEETAAWQRVVARLEKITQIAADNHIGIFYDAEETWIQDSIDELVIDLMKRYNKTEPIVYNTFQMYRHDRLDFLKKCFGDARKEGYLLGAKLVRGAYMDKERERAAEMGYPSPINPTKEASDRSYNEALKFCVENYEYIASCNATHNQASTLLQANLIAEKGIVPNHRHLNFCQLYGMSDHLTFNLAKAGYNVAKYVVYGSVREVIPYLIRRTKENTSLTGDMSREYSYIHKEVKRRNL